ncbi:MAG: rRNA adenine N-6-methyltransferase family protein, partial [Candidatus Paceibacterota bacterium]
LDGLLEKFANEINDKKLFIAHGDILELNASKLFAGGDYKLVANIPYYITGQVIRKFLSEPARNASQREAGGEEIQPSRMVLMVQKEVAKRITVNPSPSLRVTDKESLLSLSVKCYGTPKYIKTVPAGAFEPKPNVDSAILLIENISRDYFSDISEADFFKLLKKGFAQKRKLLKGNLRPRLAEVASREALAKWDKKIDDIFKTCNIPPKARAENLTLENWKCLVQVVN